MQLTYLAPSSFFKNQLSCSCAMYSASLGIHVFEMTRFRNFMMWCFGLHVMNPIFIYISTYHMAILRNGVGHIFVGENINGRNVF